MFVATVAPTIAESPRPPISLCLETRIFLALEVIQHSSDPLEEHGFPRRIRLRRALYLYNHFGCVFVLRSF